MDWLELDDILDDLDKTEFEVWGSKGEEKEGTDTTSLSRKITNFFSNPKAPKRKYRNYELESF